jgi:predicted branched-subunit amino acid permease
MHTRNPDRTAERRAMWTAIILISSVIVALIAGLFARAAGVSLPGAVLTGGSAFAGSVAVTLALWHFATGRAG